MKYIFIAALISTSGIALAQEAPAEDQAAQPSGETVDDPSQSTGPQGVTQQGTDPDGQAVAPPGTNQGMSTTTDASALTPRPAATEYPPCSKTVTDSCVQTYERGVRRNRRR